MKTNCFKTAALEILPMEDIIEFYSICCKVYINDQLGAIDNFPSFIINPEIHYEKKPLLKDIVTVFNKGYDSMEHETQRGFRILRKVKPPTSYRKLAKRRYTLHRLTRDIIAICKIRFKDDFNFKKNNTIRVFDGVCCENYLRYTTKDDFKRMFFTASADPQSKYVIAHVTINRNDYETKK